MSDQRDPQQQNQDPMGGDSLLEGMVQFMARHISTKLVAEQDREAVAMEFVEMLGRLVEFLERFKPLSVPKMAALLYFTEMLDVDRFQGDQAWVALKMVEAAKNVARHMRRQAKPA